MIKFLWGGLYSPHEKCNLDVEQLSNTINYINGCSELPTPTPDKSHPPTADYQDSANQVKIEMIGKLRQLGLKDEQIAEALGLALEVVKQID